MLDSGVTVSACNGKCCQSFYLGSSKDQLIQLLQVRPTNEDLQKVVEMVVPIPPSDEFPDPVNLFTCRHYDPFTNKCDQYEARPRMCRDFPYGQVCSHCGQSGLEPFTSPPTSWYEGWRKNINGITQSIRASAVNHLHNLRAKGRRVLSR